MIEVWFAASDTPKAAAWALLKEAVRARGLSALPEVARHPGGKPYFPDCPALHFSLSHTEGFALCALGDAPVGCDIEAVRPRREGTAEFALGPAELAWFHARGRSWADFALLWTRKEAAVKQSGAGLPFRPSQIAVPLPPEDGMDGLVWRSWRGEGWAAGLCFPRDAGPVELRQPPQDFFRKG